MKYDYKGTEYNQKEIAKLVGKSDAWVSKNVIRCKSIEELINKAKFSNVARYPKKILYKGKCYTLKELAEYSNMKYHTLAYRLYNGWSVDDAVETPLKINTGK